MSEHITSACNLTVLAKQRPYSVELCACNIVYLTIGPMTMRLEAKAFEDLVQTLNQGQSALQERCICKPKLRLVSNNELLSAASE